MEVKKYVTEFTNEQSPACWSESWRDILTHWRCCLVDKVCTLCDNEAETVFLHIPRRGGKTATIALLAAIACSLYGEESVRVVAPGKRPALIIHNQIEYFWNELQYITPPPSQSVVITSREFHNGIPAETLKFLAIDEYASSSDGEPWLNLKELHKKSAALSMILLASTVYYNVHHNVPETVLESIEFSHKLHHNSQLIVCRWLKEDNCLKILKFVSAVAELNHNHHSTMK